MTDESPDEHGQSAELLRHAVQIANKADIELATLFADDPSFSRIHAFRKSSRRDAIDLAHTADILTRMPEVASYARATGTISVRHGDAVWSVANEYAHHLDEQHIMGPLKFDAYLAHHVVDLFEARGVHYPTASELANHLRKILAVEFPVAFGAGEKEKDSRQSATKYDNSWRLTMPGIRSQRLWELVNKEARVIAETTGQDLSAARMDVIADRIEGQVDGQVHGQVHGAGETDAHDGIADPTVRTVTKIHVHVFRMVQGPGFIPGVGVISREEADHMQFHADSVDDATPPEPRGGYTPTAQQKAFVAGRDGCCRFPGCDVPATLCDKDHIEPYDHDNPAAGGPTDVANLQSLCRTHHNLKTNKLWHASTSDGGYTIAWVNTHGEEFTTYAKGILPK
ncbi:HNH endonuclease signature motif containing protein [Corynebacterium falsenii]|nr:HNH endonuclease signature motif containing protein [Corynebacterium falsenii]HJF13053.1 HNH endonuclease [Corynebacterium falsenii]